MKTRYITLLWCTYGRNKRCPDDCPSGEIVYLSDDPEISKRMARILMRDYPQGIIGRCKPLEADIFFATYGRYNPEQAYLLPEMPVIIDTKTKGEVLITEEDVRIKTDCPDDPKILSLP